MMRRYPDIIDHSAHIVEFLTARGSDGHLGVQDVFAGASEQGLDQDWMSDLRARSSSLTTYLPSSLSLQTPRLMFTLISDPRKPAILG
jgi:hypothetical protein